MVVVVAALIGVLAVPALRSHTQSGSATAAPVERTPAVGDCLIQRPVDALRVDVRGTDGLSAPELGSCRDSHYGEMVAVVADGSLFPRAVVDRLSAPDLGYCAQAAEAYLGLYVRRSLGTPGQTDVGFGLWYPVERGWVLLTGPSQRQQQVGQRWVGCAMYSDDAAYLGSARRSFVDSHLPDAFAMCRNDIGETANLNCAGAHQVELFGNTTLTGAQIDQADLTSSCRSMVEKVTGMPDPTAGGRLIVAATLFHTDAGGIRRQGSAMMSGGQATASATCSIAVRGRQSLRGTLFGLGARPVPLS